ncbi:MAG: phosphopantothenate--cysteine ligase [Oscillospiraceae bacterium]|nr:phosphopantothenate--cysteine ligase [Oscillospiraceae bacterium]
MNVLITSGGTTERIDTVRSISNMSTGSLGSMVADRFSGESSIEKIFYICGMSAIRPLSERVAVKPVDSVANLESVVRETLGSSDIDIIIHAMAVSDYRARSVMSADSLAGSIVSNLGKLMGLDGSAASSAVLELLKSHESAISLEGKISSDMDGILLFMERTPKIIALFHELSPRSMLIGFKLLDNVPLDALMDAGYKLLIQNKCSFVLANDLRDISDKQHTGYLIDKEKNYTRHSSKAEIAAAIVAAAINERTKVS